MTAHRHLWITCITMKSGRPLIGIMCVRLFRAIVPLPTVPVRALID
jgi:hypothetical protein